MTQDSPNIFVLPQKDLITAIKLHSYKNCDKKT